MRDFSINPSMWPYGGVENDCCSLEGSIYTNPLIQDLWVLLKALPWFKIDCAQPWMAGSPNADSEAVVSPKFAIDGPTAIDTAEFPTTLLAKQVTDDVDPQVFGRIGMTFDIPFNQWDATIRASGGNNPLSWRMATAMASCISTVNNQFIHGDADNTNEFNGLLTIATANENVISPSGATAADTRFDIAKLIACVSSMGRGATALVGNKEAQQLLTQIFDNGSTMYGPGPDGCDLIPFYNGVPFFRADVNNVDGSPTTTSVLAINTRDCRALHTSGTASTFGFEHRSVENISGSVPRSAATNHIIYGGHSLDVTSPGAVYALTDVDVDAFLG